MILLVEGDRGTFAQVSELLESATIERATTIGAARKRLARTDPTVLLTTTDLDQATAALLADVRAGRFGLAELPVASAVDDDGALATALGVDVAVPTPLEASALQDAVERARVLGKYRTAIGEFYDVCRRVGEGAATAEHLSEARQEADRWLSAIEMAEEPVPVEALLGTS